MSSTRTEEEQEAFEIALWKQKRELEKLEECDGQHTNLVTLLIPPSTQLVRVNKLLTTEMGTAQSIKSKATRTSVIEALKSISHRVKLMS